MPKKKKGTSQSTRPISKRALPWCSYKPEEVEAIILKLSKEGLNPSRIGTILRDQHGIPLTKPIVGKRISQILKEQGLAPSIPEDLQFLLKKASSLRIHLEKNKKDLHNKRALQVIEARIYSLSKYYKNNAVLPPKWKYKSKTGYVV